MARPKRSQRMNLLYRLLGQELETCLKQLGLSQQELQKERQQLESLEHYQAEYQQRQRNTLIRAQGGLGMQSYMQFLQQLSQAIEQQQQRVEMCQATCEQLQKKWQLLDNKQKNFARLVKQYQGQEAQQVEKKLQAEIDDLSARRNAHNT